MPRSSAPTATTESPTIASVPAARLRDALRGAGIALYYGAATARVRSRLAPFADQLCAVYGAFPFREPADFSDVHVDVLDGAPWRPLRRQAVLQVDRQRPFEPFPVDGALPLFEWGVNWFVAQRLHQHLLLHAGVVAIDDVGILMAAPPGSGKSTLTAALSLAGYRLLSDEFGVMRIGSRHALPMLKPVALKNHAIDVIRRRHPEAVFGPTFEKTRKGDVAHLAPNTASIAACERAADIRVILFPRWVEGAALATRAVAPTEAFTRLGFNCFNYALRGPEAFDTLATLVAGARAWELVYSDLDEAIGCIGSLLADARGGA